MRRPVSRHVVAVGVFTLAALVLTWPLLPRITTHVPGDGIDDPALAWNLWWVKARLVDQLSPNLFDVDWMFHPIHVNLAFYTLTPLNGLISVPLQTALQLVVASNLILLSSFVLGAYGTFLLALYVQSKAPLREPPTSEVRRHAPYVTTTVAIAAAIIFAFASAKLFYAALGQFNIASSQWIPFAALYMLRTRYSTSTRDALRNGGLAGLFIVVQAWSELTYASFLLIFFALVTAWWVYLRLRVGSNDAPLASWREYGAGLCAAAVVFLVGLGPYFMAMVPDLLKEGDFFASGGGFADVFSADLIGYLVPTVLHPLFGQFTATLPFAHDKGQHIYLGYIPLLLALLGVYAFGVRRLATRGNLVWFWTISALGFWMLTLGPHVRWAGNELPIPGPFALISRIPFFSGNRYPSRYSVMLLLSVSILAVYGLRAVADYVARRTTGASWRIKFGAATVLVVGLLIFEHLSVPLRLTDFRIPELYAQLAEDPDDFTLLELPTGWRNGARVMGRSDVLIMMQQWYQSEHAKRRLGGNTSRNPLLKLQYFTDAPVIGELIALMNGDREHIAAVIQPEFDALAAQIRDEAPGVLEFLGVKYIALHVEESPDLLVRMVEEALPVELVTTWTGNDWTGSPSSIRLYEVKPAARQEGWSIDLAAPEGRLHTAEGWSTLDGENKAYRYATRNESILLLDIPDQGGTLQIDLADIGGGAELKLNGERLDATILPGDNVLEVAIPAGVAGQPVDRLSMKWNGPFLGAQDLARRNQRETAGRACVFDLSCDVTVGVRSAGEEVGDFAHIYVNGTEVSPNERGYNLVAFTTEGEVLDARAFDTHAYAQASEEMASWLTQWPLGTLIAGAVADEASYNLQDVAVNALKELGLAADLRGKFRWSHAFVGAAGGGQGAALEETNLIRPAGVSIGPPVDAPEIWGGVGNVRFQPSN